MVVLQSWGKGSNYCWNSMKPGSQSGTSVWLSFFFQWLLVNSLFLIFKFWYENINISNISCRGGWTGLGMAKSGTFPTLLFLSHFSPTVLCSTRFPYFCSIYVWGYVLICMHKHFKKSTFRYFFDQVLVRPIFSTKSMHTDFALLFHLLLCISSS